MIYAKSEYTKKLEPCTIHTGVVGHDGVRRFAWPDIDLVMDYADSEWDLGDGRS